MADPFADADDVATAWRPLTSSEIDSVNQKVRFASAMLRTQYPGIDNQITSGAVDIDIVTWVVTEMVKTAMIGQTSSAGASQTSDTVGPYSHQASYKNPTGNLYITAAMDQAIRGYIPAGGTFQFGNDTTNFFTWDDVAAGYSQITVLP